MRKTVWIALALVLAGVMCFAYVFPGSRTRAGNDGARPEQPSKSAVAPGPARLAAAPARAPEPRAQRTLEERQPAEHPSDVLITEALREHARAGFARGWGQLRRDELSLAKREELLAEFERTVLALPESRGRHAAELELEREAKARALSSSDGVDWLARVEANTEELALCAADPERFAGFFRPRSSGAAIDGPTLRDEDPLADGSTIQFPAGVFAVADLARDRTPFPKDVTVRGAGRDATLLVMQDLNPRSALERFTVEDCTVFAERGSLVDVRSGPAVLTLRRMRLTGFDCGAGGSYALELRASALSAIQCRFESGYGRNPDGLANLMRGGSALAARFEGCVFERMSLQGATQKGVVFAHCSMIDLLDEPGPGPVYQDCSITVLPPEKVYDAEVRTRDLNELFPDWRERLQQR